MEKICWSTINNGRYPRPICAGFYQTNKIITKTKREKNLIEKGELNTVEGIFHIHLNGHTFLIPLETGVKGFLHLNHIVYNMSSFNKPPYRGEIKIPNKGLSILAKSLARSLYEALQSEMG